MLVALAQISIASGTELPDFPFVFANGETKTNVAPDIATISFNLAAFDADPTNALSTVDKISTEVLTLIDQQNIAGEDVEAFQIEKRAERERKDYVELRILGYTVSRRFALTIRDLSKFDPTMKALLALTNVVEIESTFDRTDRETVEAQLIAAASADARKRAQSLADGFGVELGPVFAISQQGLDDFANSFGVDGSVLRSSFLEMGETKEMYYVPATITLDASVTAIFRLGKSK